MKKEATQSTPTTEFQAGYAAADKLWRECFLGLIFNPFRFSGEEGIKILQCPSCKTVYEYNAEADDKICPHCLESAAAPMIGKLRVHTLSCLRLLEHPILAEKYVQQLAELTNDLLGLIKTTVAPRALKKLTDSCTWTLLTHLVEIDEQLKDFFGQSLPPIEELIQMTKENTLPIKAINSLKALSQTIKSCPKPD